jgi:transposase InsO family protein
VVPRNAVPDILKQIHNDSSGGHLGITKTLQMVRDRFYWLNCTNDVKDWCRKCTTCAASNGPHRKPKAEMQQYLVGSPFERIAVDVLGPLPQSDVGNKYIFVVMDYFTKWVEAYAVPNQEATTLADILVGEFVSRFGVPLELHSDQGRNFESKLFQEVCQRLGIHKTRTTAMHPQSDGMVERMNRTITNYLSKVVSECQRDWDRHIPLFLMAIRSAINESTGQTPAKVLFGREMRLPCDLVFGCKPGEVAREEYVGDLQNRMENIHNLVRGKLQLSSDRMKRYYDTRTMEKSYQVGDLVWLYNPRRRRGVCPKLQKNWEGPYTIKKKINDVIYRIVKIPRGKPVVVHHDRLVPYQGNHSGGV